MATISDLCTTIIGDLQRNDTSLSDIVLIDIQSSIREYEAQRFFFNEAKLTCTLSATDTYALTLFAPSGVADVVEVDQVQCTANSSTYDLDELNIREINSLNAANSGTGLPTRYAVFNQSLTIYPKAGSNYLATVWAHVRFNDVTISTTSVWSNAGFELIRNATLRRLWGRRFKQPELAQGATAMERDALTALQRRTEALAGNSIPGYL